MEMIIASNNQRKIAELNSIDSQIKVIPYTEFMDKVDFIEDGTTYLENAEKKAKTVYQKLNRPVLGDDGGLELSALPNLLGLHTSRYFNQNDSEATINQKILSLLQNKTNREFVLWSTLVYYQSEKKSIEVAYYSEGVIADKPRGEEGYGFDSILQIPNKRTTLAELDDKSREKYSPRILAFKELSRRIDIHG